MCLLEINGLVFFIQRVFFFLFSNCYFIDWKDIFILKNVLFSCIKVKGRKKEERILRLSAILQYRVLSEDRFSSPIFSLQLLLAVALDRRPA
jgi:hypothetical protein